LSATPKDYDVGYGRTPKRTRWKKGKSGNSFRRRSVRNRSAVETIERLFLKPVEIILHGVTRKVSALEAIVRLISQKALSGDRQALAAQMKYQEFAAKYHDRKVQIVFVESEYTTALAAQPSLKGKDSE
jgi:Family of unknown function (DUF5681)